MEENTSTLDIRAINEKIERESAFIDLFMEMNKVIVKAHDRKIIDWTLAKDIFC
jgi:hypothetical protein